MKLLFVLCAISLAAASAPPPGVSSGNAKVLKYENDNTGYGGFRYSYEQSDGTKQEQFGEVKNKDSENPTLEVKGSFSWIGPDGVSYSVTYTANEDGYKPDMEQGPGGAVPLAVLHSMAG